jgi:photosystem II stability/assembly factor-like uncharacterized protein
MHGGPGIAFALEKSAVRMARVAITAALLCGAAQAQVHWTRIPGAPKPDPDWSWGPGLAGKSSRMAGDSRGTVFISQGDSLLIGGRSGRDWSAKPVRPLVQGGFYDCLAVGAGGKMLWGPQLSRDWGKHWTPAARDSVAAFAVNAATAFAIGPDGSMLAGFSSEGLVRSADDGATWKYVHMGYSYSNIRDIAYGPSGWAFAAPNFARLLMSRDGGVTWSYAPESPDHPASRQDSGFPPSSWVMGSHFARESAGGRESMWSVDQGWGRRTTLYEIAIESASLHYVYHANAGFPDSLITDLKAYVDTYQRTTLWLGTWGEGMFVSKDRGETLEKASTGLGDARVEALHVLPSGEVLALTPAGLFTSAGSNTAILPGPGDGNRAPPVPADSRGIRAPDGSVFRADGRIVRPIHPKLF